jgi:flagellar biosynthesis/type III secretory pathway protein FliH
MREQVFNLFRFIDWLMALPETLQQRFDQDLTRFDEETRMEFITSFERRGIEQGREEGREEGMRRSTCEAVLEILTVRFGGIPDEVAQALDRIEDPSLLKGLLRTALTSPSLDAFRHALPGSPA